MKRKQIYKPKDDSFGAKFTAEAMNRAYYRRIDEMTSPIHIEYNPESPPEKHAVTIDVTDAEFAHIVEIFEREIGRLKSRIRSIEKYPSESHVVTEIRIEKLQNKICDIESYIARMAENTF